MNLYFWFLATWALCITPVTLHVSLRMGRRMRYRLRLQIAGLPFVRKTPMESPMDEQPVDEDAVARTLSPQGMRLLSAGIKSGALRLVLRHVHIEQMYAHVRFSFDDAAQNALCCAAACTVLQTLHRCCPRARRVQARLEADFGRRGTEVFVRGIVSVRLGSLALAAVRLAAALTRQTEKEETYAASH